MPDAPSRSTAKHLPLHPLEFQVLLTLVEGVAHAYEIVRRTEARQPEWSRILPTNLYRRIWRLEARGLIVRASGDREHARRERTYFSLTPLGRRVAEAEAARLRELLQQARAAGVISGVAGR
jgi:DNA-binding PadR family transcriptional regulator